MYFFMQAMTESLLCRRKCVEEIGERTEKNDVCEKLPTHTKEKGSEGGRVSTTQFAGGRNEMVSHNWTRQGDMSRFVAENC